MFDQLYLDLILKIKDNKYDFLNLELINLELLAAVKSATKDYNTIIIIGFGASSLNTRALLSASFPHTKKVIYFDSLDQVEINEKLSLINDLNETLFFSLSKSGNTNETYLLTKYVLGALSISPKNTYIISPIGNNLLYNLSKTFKTHFVEHDNVGSGRFGIISNASLLPAVVAGLDVNKVLAASFKKISDVIGGQSNICHTSSYYLQQYVAGRHIFVTFNYSYSLDGLCKWQQQIMAESLGKNGFGITPLLARGTFDQHSQLQLYLEGPDDKFCKIITSNNLNTELGLTLASHANNIYQALIKEKRPVFIENLLISEETIIGQIIDTIFSTILLADYLKINPFDQPAVDRHK